MTNTCFSSNTIDALIIHNIENIFLEGIVFSRFLFLYVHFGKTHKVEFNGLEKVSVVKMVDYIVFKEVNKQF